VLFYLSFGIGQPGVIELLRYPAEEAGHFFRLNDQGCHGHFSIPQTNPGSDGEYSLAAKLM
jgi:hypothetical protein